MNTPPATDSHQSLVEALIETNSSTLFYQCEYRAKIKAICVNFIKSFYVSGLQLI